MVRLLVQGVDNPAWQTLSEAEQGQYAHEVLAAVVAEYPVVETTRGSRPAYYAVKIYETVRLSFAEAAALDDTVACARADPGSRHQGMPPPKR